MNANKLLPTWSGSKTFQYTGSIQTGITIEFGSNFNYRGEFSSNDLQRMLNHFAEREVPLGTAHSSTATPGSVAEWIKVNINNGRVMTSYLGPILVSEGHAEKNGKMIRFKSNL